MATASSDTNLQILRRMDADVDDVLATAAHVCLYYMHVDTQQWVRWSIMPSRSFRSEACHLRSQARKNVEGSLFLLKRRTEPRFKMMVLNKLSTGAFAWPSMRHSFHVQLHSAPTPYPCILFIRGFSMPHMTKPPLLSENYVENIHAGLDFEINAPYLMYTHGNSEVGMLVCLRFCVNPMSGAHSRTPTPLTEPLLRRPSVRSTGSGSTTTPTSTASLRC